ncbi:class I adenylate-forming enzyme family protein [Marinibacterium sp. SX1]|uniref:class I adenylate-forming enzyme family protein n=1 Tax=Marinibacterium sp. SX1 TaxID=3388424 RepID=UPI003D1710C9
MSHDEAAAHLIATNPVFATTTARIRGSDYRVFANTPAHLRDLLIRVREVHGNGADDYLSYGDERWTYDAFCAEICALAEALRKRGIAPGDRVAIAMRNYPEMLVLFLAISAIGGVVVFVNAWWTEDELDYAMRDSRPALILADGPRMTRLLALKDKLGLQLIGLRDGAGIAPETYEDLRATGLGAGWPDVAIDTDDDFAIMYSSGTTGHPKGVVLTHRGAINAVYTWLLQSAIHKIRNPGLDDTAQSVILVATPLFHVTATHPVFLFSLPAGARIVLMHKWDADEAVRLIRHEKVTRFMGVPTQSADLMDKARARQDPLETLGYIGAGGAKRPSAQVGQLAQTFPEALIATGWGMTETNAVGIGMAGPDYVDRPGACGRLFPPVQDVRFLCPQGRDVAPGEIGEITVRSPCNMREYLNKPDATAEVLQDGWLRTGDLGRIDAEGFITIVDRAKNIIIRGGENIACLDVESALHQHPDVAEACVFPLPHERLGETVGALVQLRPEATATAEALRDFLAGHIAHFKIPEHLWMQGDPLPRGATDKLDRRGIRQDCTDRLAAGLIDSQGGRGNARIV